MTYDLIRYSLDQMIHLRLPLAELANRMPWQEKKAALAHRLARQVKEGQKIEVLVLFGQAMIFFEHQWPCYSTKLGRFRRALLEESSEELVACNMDVAVTLKLIAKKNDPRDRELQCAR